MTTTHPIYRAYHKPTNSFIHGLLSTDGRFLVHASTGEFREWADVHIEFFTGRVADSGQGVYDRDVVQVATPSGFGSMMLDEGVVRYDISLMCYTISSKFNGIEEPLPTQIIKVIGHDHD